VEKGENCKTIIAQIAPDLGQEY